MPILNTFKAASYFIVSNIADTLKNIKYRRNYLKKNDMALPVEIGIGERVTIFSSN